MDNQIDLLIQHSEKTRFGKNGFKKSGSQKYIYYPKNQDLVLLKLPANGKFVQSGIARLTNDSENLKNISGELFNLGCHLAPTIDYRIKPECGYFLQSKAHGSSLHDLIISDPDQFINISQHALDKMVIDWFNITINIGRIDYGGLHNFFYCPNRDRVTFIDLEWNDQICNTKQAGIHGVIASQLQTFGHLDSFGIKFFMDKFEIALRKIQQSDLIILFKDYQKQARAG